MLYEKSRLFNKEDRMHNTHTIRSGMVPGVQKVGPLHSIDQGAKKCESEGAENGPFPHKVDPVETRAPL